VKVNGESNAHLIRESEFQKGLAGSEVRVQGCASQDSLTAEEEWRSIVFEEICNGLDRWGGTLFVFYAERHVPKPSTNGTVIG
jgi:hypothetical protein